MFITRLNTLVVFTAGLALTTAYIGHAPLSDPVPNERRTRSIVARDFNPSEPYENWPSYSQLPLNTTYPTAAAWGVWGADDVNGALNHITNATILAAAQEIQLGLAINLNLELDKFITPINTARKPLTHLYQPEPGYTDDVVMMNTQINTQFDGLRHFPYSNANASTASYRWYNDLIPDYEDVIGPNPTTVLGIQQAAQKGIAGRAVLLDWAGYAEANNISFDAFAGRGISAAEWDAVAAWQGLPSNWSKPGDFLITRTGWTQKFNTLNQTEVETLPWLAGPNGMESIGFLASDDSLAWLWEKKLALVGADNPAFESLPMNKTIGGVPRSLHQVFIGGWGQSIVEFLDLETLTEKLHELNRFSFFMTIQNLNIVSGIASPPNALAIL